ncbi:Alpha/Beta hydrolase protein [Hyaloraphidium curvatum]|nr:Alpha/Beta hydrolase protein [Hyaloraphidium curvatum]
MAAAPLAPVKDGVVLTEVVIPRAPVPGLEEKNEGELVAEWQIKEGTPKDAPVVVWYHGGAYTISTVASYRDSSSEMSVRGLRVLSVEYRLAPEAPFPAAVADGVIAYKWLLAQGEKPSNIVLAGDSAGGGLTFGVATYLRDHGLPLPAGLAVFTPWVDATFSGPTIHLGDEFDMCVLPKGQEKGWLVDSAKVYIKDSDKYSPYVSFLADSKGGMPPTYIETGTVDRFYAEDIALAVTRAALGDTVVFEMIAEQPHAFYLIPPVPAVQSFYDRVVGFVRDATTGKVKGGFSHVNPDGSSTPVTVQEAKARLAALFARDGVPKPDARMGEVFAKAMAK